MLGCVNGPDGETFLNGLKMFPRRGCRGNVSPSGLDPTGQHMRPRARRGNMQKCFPVEAMEMLPGRHPDGETLKIQKSAVFTPTRKHFRTCLKYVSPSRPAECFPVELVGKFGVTAPTGKHFPKCAACFPVGVMQERLAAPKDSPDGETFLTNKNVSPSGWWGVGGGHPPPLAHDFGQRGS